MAVENQMKIFIAPRFVAGVYLRFSGFAIP